MPEPTLTALAAKYGTDKGTQDVDVVGFFGQRYTEVYEHWCAPRRDTPLRILEIGVHEGASLRMWAEYFPQAQVHGIDNAPVAPVTEFGDRVSVFTMDQRHIGQLLTLAVASGPFDLIVDDGCHERNAILTSAATLVSHLAHGGLYAIEDVPHGECDTLLHLLTALPFSRCQWKLQRGPYAVSLIYGEAQ